MSAHGPSVLWYATRGAGAVTLLLLTASVVLGIAELRRWQPAGAPRFAVASLHRTASLLALVLLAIHIATTVLDPFPPIGLLAAIVPFSGSYRPLWLGLGAVASDTLLAVVLTSLVRRRLGYRAWRGVHWLAYACWPIALVHGLGTGSDVKSTWMLVLVLACIGAVVAALAGRLARSGAAVRALVGATVAASVIVLGAWLAGGPLATGWARRSGTPEDVLAAFAPRPPATARSDALAAPFSADLVGSVRDGDSSGGAAVVDLRLHGRGRPRVVLRIRIAGRRVTDGGVVMERSAVALGPPSDPGRYQGRIQRLDGARMQALVGAADGSALRLRMALSLGDGRAAGTLRSAPVGEAEG